jgi:hypothetical protein
MFPMPIFINDDSGEANGHPFSWGQIFYPKERDKIDVLKEPWQPAYRRSIGCLDMHC